MGGNARLARLAETFKRNRAKYDARRKAIRDLAAAMRRGERPRAAADLLAAARRWLDYREAYNLERRAARVTARPKSSRRTPDGQRSPRADSTPERALRRR